MKSYMWLIGDDCGTIKQRDQLVKNKVDNVCKKYRVSIKVDEYRLPFVKVGDELIISYRGSDNVNEIESIE